VDLTRHIGEGSSTNLTEGRREVLSQDSDQIQNNVLNPSSHRGLLPDSWMVLKMAEKIQVKYEELNQLISQILEQADQTKGVYEKLRSQTETLERSWRGAGSNEFQQEMDDLVLPSLKRLSHSLEETGESLGRVKEVFLEAEEEAAACFPDDSEDAQNNYIEWAHRVLTAAGFIEWGGIGIGAGVLDAALYGYEGRWSEAGWSLVAAIPFGDYIKAAKMGGKAGREILEESLEAGAKFGDDAAETAMRGIDETVGRTKNKFLPFTDVKPGMRDIATERVEKLSNTIGHPIPKDRILEAEHVGVIKNRSGRATSQANRIGYERNESRFWTAFKERWPEDYKLIKPGRRISPELAEKYGWPKDVVGEKLVHHHVDNLYFTVAIPESWHKKFTKDIHEEFITVAKPE
jgi:WXG100 family type VII secretion target